MQRSKGRSILGSSSPSSQMPGTRPCPWCGGNGEVYGVVDDVAFTFQCSGGSERGLQSQSLQRGRKMWKRHKDKPPQWWFQTCGLTEEDLQLLG
jgi:hypothetical protein